MWEEKKAYKQKSIKKDTNDDKKSGIKKNGKNLQQKK